MQNPDPILDGSYRRVLTVLFMTSKGGRPGYPLSVPPISMETEISAYDIVIYTRGSILDDVGQYPPELPVDVVQV